MHSLTILAIGMAGLAAVNCGSTRPVHYYTLQPAPLVAKAAPAGAPVILVGAITMPEALQDGRIQYRVGSNEVAAYEYHHWVERPGVMVRESLMRALAASGRYERVMEAGSGATGDYLVRGKLNEFGEVDDPAVKTKISLRVEVVDRKTNRPVWERAVEREEPASGKTMNAVVQAMERNLQEVAREAASGIDEFLASRRQP
jgi:ABC-type uncharacterized transport system auxiliary subunit